MSKVLIKIGTVVEVEDNYSKDSADGLRVRVKLNEDKPSDNNNLPWAFPLLPKTLQSIPKVGEGVLVVTDSLGAFSSGQRYYIGPLISQPQYQEFCKTDDGTTLLQSSSNTPLEKISNDSMTDGAFPKKEDVALVGRGQEDIELRFDPNSKTSEVNIRAGIRQNPMSPDNPNMIGNIIFNGADPAYIQLKYKKGLAPGQKHPCSSMVNVVADYVNIMSNYDWNVADKIHDKDTLMKDDKADEIMNSLHQVPKGDKLVELLTIMKGCIMNHVHPWAGMKQCGDWEGFINKLEGYDINSILSDFVRIS